MTETSRKHVFMMKHGSAADLHKIIDNQPYMNSNHAFALENNPSYGREHAEKLLNSDNWMHVATAFRAGNHITTADMDRHIDHPNDSVKNSIVNHSWDPKHFVKAFRSSWAQMNYGAAKWILDKAHSRGALSKELLDNGEHHADDEVKHMAYSLRDRLK